jgi:hypothetical protein
MLLLMVVGELWYQYVPGRKQCGVYIARGGVSR